MLSFKALRPLICAGVEYAPGDIIPGASSFPNLKEMIEHRYIGYGEEIQVPIIKDEETKQEQKTVKKAEDEPEQTDEKEKTPK